MTVIKTLTQFQRKYKLIQHLGQGGYGSVYLCQEIRSKKYRAVKVMDDVRCNNKSWSARHKDDIPNEILLWEPLSHPNIHALLDFYLDRDAGKWYLIMEYDLNYQDLFSFVDIHGALTTRDSSNIIQQVVRVVHFLTLQGVDHRDLKDENILYNPKTKQIKLIDFGSAARLSPDPYTSFRGTDVYIPPEYYNHGKYYSFHAAVWAMGCLSFVLMAGDCPFDSRSAVKEFKSMEDFSQPEYKERTKRLNFIRLCLEPDPEKRGLLSDLLEHPWLKMKAK